VHVARMGKKKNTWGFSDYTSQRNHVEDLGLDGMIILKWTQKK